MREVWLTIASASDCIYQGQKPQATQAEYPTNVSRRWFWFSAPFSCRFRGMNAI